MFILVKCSTSQHVVQYNSSKQADKGLNYRYPRTSIQYIGGCKKVVTVYDHSVINKAS